MESNALINWHWRDMSNGLCLHYVGARAYNYLYQKGFPHVSTSKRVFILAFDELKVMESFEYDSSLIQSYEEYSSIMI